MKPRVDLYLLNANSFDNCFRFACQLAEKVYQQEHSLLVHLQSIEHAQHFDQLLWTFRPTSFLPHQWAINETKITISHLQAHPPTLLMNLKLSPVPPEPGPWQRLLQIVPNQADLLELARQHYRYYQQQGMQINTHRIKN